MDLHLDESIELLRSIDLDHCHIFLRERDVEVLVLIGCL